MKKNIEIEMAEQRIQECEERRKEFAAKFEQTNQSLYRKLAESETEMIEEIRQAIVEALLNK